MTTPLIISIISLCLCVSCFFFCRWYITRKTAARELLADYRDEVYRLIGEIDAATDRDSLLVEERIKMLRKILEDTDRRISVYMKEVQRSHTGEAMYASLGRGIRVALDSRLPLIEPTPPKEATPPQEATAPKEMTPPQEVILPLLETQPPTDAATDAVPEKKRGGKKRQNPAPSEQTPLQPTPAKPKLKVQIAEMSAQGLSPPEIASRLHLSLAEVDLALNLLHRPGIG